MLSERDGGGNEERCSMAAKAATMAVATAAEPGAVGVAKARRATTAAAKAAKAEASDPWAAGVFMCFGGTMYVVYC